jgi:hypothetical protein
MLVHRSDAVEPDEQHCDRPRVVAQAVTGANEEAELGRAVSGGVLSGVGSGHTLVVVAMHHEHRGGAKRRAASIGRKRRNARLHSSNEA